jgi:hypothetical protein
MTRIKTCIINLTAANLSGKRVYFVVYPEGIVFLVVTWCESKENSYLCKTVRNTEFIAKS